jgi:hypothetical protein
MGQFIDTIPTWLLALLICGGSVVLTVMTQTVLHRFWPVEARKPLNELAGFIIAVVGVVYAVLLASIAILAIERYDRAEQNVETEAGLVSDLYRDAIGFPQPLRGEVRAYLLDYAELVVSNEWPAMEAGLPLGSGWQNEGWLGLQEMLRDFANFTPQSDAERAFLQEALSRTNDLIDARRARLFISSDGIKPVIWWVVALGAVTTVGLALVFGIQNPQGHLMVSSILALSISFVLLLIVSMDRPFSGASRVTSEPFAFVKERLLTVTDD